MDDDFLSEEMASDSDSESLSSFADNNSEAVEFSLRVKNQQIETLKLFKRTLDENKQLKRRLAIVENELDKYQTFRNILPLVDQSTGMEAITPRPTVQSPKLDPLRETNDIGVQVNLEVTKKKTTKLDVCVQANLESIDLPQASKPIEKTEEKQPVRKKTEHKWCQCEDVRLTEANDQIGRLNVQMGELAEKSRQELEHAQSTIVGLNEKIAQLETTIAGLNKSLEMTGERLNESHKENLTLIDQNKQIDPLREQLDLSKAENRQLYEELAKRQTSLEEKMARIGEMEDELVKSSTIVLKQKENILRLEEEIVQHVNEKHTQCEKTISELSKECEVNKETMSKQAAEINALNEKVDYLNKNVERYKSDLKNFNFKEFISMRRELNLLKQEKERAFTSTLNNQTTAPNNVTPPLPPIKANKNKNPFNFFN